METGTGYQQYEPGKIVARGGNPIAAAPWQRKGTA